MTKKARTSTAPAQETTSIESILNPTDFKSVRLEIALVNHTTRTEVRNGTRTYGGAKTKDPNAKIGLVEFLEQGMVIEAPKNSCSTGHNVMLEIEVVGAPRSLSFHCSGKVISKELISPETDSLTVQLVQYGELQWVALQEIYSSRQNEIERFFQSVRGW